ncbi:hypothetical protein C922_02792 [Plasmodium inui San Antonio 1]|uniref:Uncharacterized protein n=1 Tax=Plasmodium inui San Antonio 1 TaxID=1237626 RepID=W7A0T7_9APIC|nr:hypothetical protein C922_02792 [Plasmodium inui San Antonio 1]EUD66807.1 hypothetical protein C922_02792 [Plasmodium inui San Antonio 1]
MLLTRDPLRNKTYHFAFQAFFHSLQNGGPKRENSESWGKGSKIGLHARSPLHRHRHRTELTNLMQIRGASRQARRTAISSDREAQKKVAQSVDVPVDVPVGGKMHNPSGYSPRNRIGTDGRIHSENDYTSQRGRHKVESEMSIRAAKRGSPQEESQKVKPELNAVNNLCKKIFYLSKNGVKNENVWKHYLIEVGKEKRNFHLVNTKNVFLLLLGLSKSEYIVKVALRRGTVRGDHQMEEAQETHIDDVVDSLINILSKRMDRLTNTQRSLLLHIIQKLHRIEQYDKVVNEINGRILEGTPLKKLSARTFSSVLHVYASGGASNPSMEGEAPTCRRRPLEETIRNAFSEPNGQQNKLVKILLKGKVGLEDILRLIGAMHKLRIRNKQILQCVVQILNEKVRDDSYFLTPSLLLHLANLNVYNEDLWRNLKMIVMQNYRFYNSVHLTNVFYGFSKFRPDNMEDLFDILASHIMDNNLYIGQCRKEEKRLSQGKSPSLNSNLFDEPKWEDPDSSRDSTIDTADTANPFNLFQTTNIIKSCLLCNYLNYNFFHFLLNRLSRSEEPQSLGNQIDSLRVVSDILKTFNGCVYKHVVCFHYTQKGKNASSMQDGQHTYVHLLNSENSENSQNSQKQMQTYRFRYDMCGSHLPMVDSLSVSSTPKEEQRQFETYFDEVSEKVRKKMEQNLGARQLKILLHKLILSLSASTVRFVNLYALCLIVLEENKKDLSVNNLFIYVQIFHRMKLYNYELFSWLVEHMKKNTHLLDVKKKMKMILLSCNIFKRINEQEMQELYRFFLSSDYSSFSRKEEAISADAAPPMWEIPAEINMKGNLVDLDRISRSTTPNGVHDETGSFENPGDDSVGRSVPVGGKLSDREPPPMDETQTDPNFALPNKGTLFSKIEKTDTLPCHVGFTDYINFLLILIHNWKGDASGRFDLLSLISKGANEIVKIGQMDATLDEHMKRLEENLHRERGTIVKLFQKLDLFSRRGPHAEEADRVGSLHGLRSDCSLQVEYLLHFVKSISEEVHDEVVRALEGRGSQMDRQMGTQMGNRCAPLKSPFELKEEDLQFLNLLRGDKGSPRGTPPTVHNNKTINRYMYGSVQETVDLLRQSFQLHRCSNVAGVSSKNSRNYPNGMESFYKINSFLISDVTYIFEKGEEKLFHFLLFYPHEMKKTVVSKCENRIFLKQECDESLLICTEVIFFYNFLRKNFRNQFLFSLVDTTPFVKFCQSTNGDAFVGGIPDSDRVMRQANRLLETISNA